MRKEEFWGIVESSRAEFKKSRPDGNHRRQVSSLTRAVEGLSSRELIEFHSHYVRRMNESNTYDLWAAAYLLAGGCSDDGFHYFRSWLISMGRAIFERALDDPDSLAQVAFGTDVEDIFFEEFAYVAPNVYEERTGGRLRSKVDYQRDVVGEVWKSEDELEERCPAIAARVQM